MSWNNLAGNQAVSGLNLQDAGFTVKAGQAIPNTSKCLTKSEAYALLEVEYLTGYELVLKSELVASEVYVNIGVPQNPFMICNNEQFIFISEPENNRVVKYPIIGGKGVVIAGNNIAGAGDYKLNYPLGIDIVNDYLMICDAGNKRVVWCNANGTPGQNYLSTLIDCNAVSNTTSYKVPVHVSGQVYSAETGLTSLVSCRLMDSISDLYSARTNEPVALATVNIYTEALTFGYYYPGGYSDYSFKNEKFLQYTDSGILRVNSVKFVNSNVLSHVSNRLDTGQIDTFRTITQSQGRIPFGFIWVPFNVIGAGKQKLISIDANYLRVHVNNGTGSVQRTFTTPYWLNDVKGMCTQRYPSLDVNGNPSKPVYILSGNRVAKWLDDLFSEVLIGIDINYFLIASACSVSYSSSSDVCSIEYDEETSSSLYSTNPNEILNINDTVYLLIGGIYSVLLSGNHYRSYLENGIPIWIYISGSGIILNKGNCGRGEITLTCYAPYGGYEILIYASEPVTSDVYIYVTMPNYYYNGEVKEYVMYIGNDSVGEMFPYPIYEPIYISYYSPIGDDFNDYVLGL